MKKRQIWIVDFGSQYTQLITRKSRELGFSSEIITVENTRERFTAGQFPNTLVLSGGPQSISNDQTDYSFLFQEKGLPILGVCYGMQIIAKYFGGTVERGVQGEYGSAKVTFADEATIFGCPKTIKVWMSHFDHISYPTSHSASHPTSNFKVIMKSHDGIIAAIKHNDRPILGLQFHPEVEHTDNGKDIMRFFYQELAGLKADWGSKTMLGEASELVKTVGRSKILCAFSGGVDSLVAATLSARVLEEGQLYCFFVDNGLLRPQDYVHIKILQEKTNLNINVIDAKAIFFGNFRGEVDPEKKRKIIGHTFIEVFEQKVHEFEREHGIHFEYLLQGTLYPDVIESISPHGKKGPSATIKSHHNVGGLPERMKLKLLEPLRYLFKDEVRKLGQELGLPHEWVFRHPFPGPGIGVRVLGELNRESIKRVQESDQILFEELQRRGLYEEVWQAFTVLIPVQTVGVKGDARAYEEVICVRIVNSSDGMTAEWSDLPRPFLARVSSRITNEVGGITRVVYDITSKPPGTIEWE